MCGIVGYAGDRQAAGILVDGLEKLEYRGYDSAGIAVFENGHICVEKAKGRLSNLEEKLRRDGVPVGNVGIGHTRWATHGEPSDINSHPHTHGRVTLVHNGIIENYLSLKHSLEAMGNVFTSETDTEVIAHLIDYYYSGDPMDAIVRAVGRLEGSYALGVLFSDIPDRLFAVRKDSPLIVGVGSDGNFIASDVPAILAHTRKYYLIDQQELAVVSGAGVRIFDFGGNDITSEKTLMTADWDVEAAEKGGYAHFMLKEIHEQPDTLKRAILPHFACGLEGILKEEIPDTSGIKRLVIVACGSAMNAGLLGKYAIEKLARVPVDVCIASEFRYADPILGEGDVVVVISQSGETADSLAALRLAKSRGVPVYAIVNVVGSSIAREADNTIYIWAGPEIAVATTKAFTSQVAVLYTLALRLAIDRKTISDERANSLAEAMKSLPDVVAKTLTDDRIALYQHLASLNRSKHDFFIIGRGQDYAAGCEGAMKIKEVSYLHCESYAAGELKHGTISLITEGVPCLAIATDRSLVEKTVSNIKEVKARGGQVVFLCTEGLAKGQDFYDYAIELPETDGLLMPIVAIVPVQTYAYYTAVYRGCDVDKPRNLAKSVTVE
ncbi:MAG: glutamine--fructose-6-phosphate transaminase (isomerizing) [Firmicutes bacterium]|jgi:glucosamine--fructose-6-phosphate aminotransferase (isomerizing)|uniref:Glutamine--fructose-6-phosphate aminotransferase [isomerizing] n=1 Tax=Candidatus Colimorpha enterica TaxID=3083063 RepID=R6UG56_9BACT|nr:glutamine--fructose-6-phosphate transaminase (isomerizing) [Candidatus Colimorpha enterica]MCI5754898.1 glutamine--fructose-6-phosphate transaminase (isomerizing) [Candidatus Colimorpha enterica]MDD6321432.1 glutamine--fructose-6-phosphate transaminase (isomerizing) [Bacillota bacterium]MDY2906043.1 glutamine--fructose-6-phosphate transaminase (isomerizing) [Eubacteriales bacterium]CDC69772.1 glucosamine--fructose-6-phosphate aminotransferase [isomerizing] [Candidatus Colimorpha enterica]